MHFNGFFREQHIPDVFEKDKSVDPDRAFFPCFARSILDSILSLELSDESSRNTEFFSDKSYILRFY